MKAISLTVALTLTSIVAFSQKKDFYDQQWSKVYKNELKGFTRSAVPQVDSIYTRAKKENNVVQLTKALIYQSKFALDLQEDAEVMITGKFRKEIALAKSPLKNILQSMLATIYWNYFQEHRNLIYQRTRTEEAVNKEDFRTWDAEQFFNEIHRNFQASLIMSKSVRDINLSALHEILVQGDDSRVYRPTLYDLLTQNAITFYKTGESLLLDAASDLSITDSTLFYRFDQLPVTTDTLSPKFLTLKLYRELIVFHHARRDTAAVVQLLVERMQYLHGDAAIDNIDETYKHALESLIAQYQHHEASTLIQYELAALFQQEGKTYDAKTNPGVQYRLQQAMKICDEAIRNFPTSDGADRCRALRDQILAQELSITNEEYVPVNRHAPMLVEYRNITQLELSAYSVNEEMVQAFLLMDDSAKLVFLKSKKVYTSWSVQLKELNDHQQHRTEIAIPPLPSHAYILFARAHYLSDLQSKVYAFGQIHVTDLALVQLAVGNLYRFQVVNRNNGEPVSNVNVHFDGIENSHFFNRDFTSDRQGFFVADIDRSTTWNFNATVALKDDTATFSSMYVSRAYYHEDDDEPETNAHTFLFTDRSIYRPGQTVYFKGILTKTRDGKSSVVGGQYVSVYIENVNGQEIKSFRLKTNAYGSFSGEFQLPSDGITGEYTLYADEDEEEDSKFWEDLDDFMPAELEISVEEYKRPTFEVTFQPVKSSFRLYDSVRVNGVASAFSGAKLSKAKVKYHVKRMVRYPGWYYWRYGPSRSESTEIISAETTTDNEGKYSVVFLAIPDETTSPDTRPVFEYEITADVTDVNGETRNASTVVKVGYHTLDAKIQAPATIDRKVPSQEIQIVTKNLNDQDVFAKGNISIYKLKAPQVALRPRIWSEPDVYTLSEDETRKLFPHHPYNEVMRPEQWEKLEKVWDNAFDTKVSRTFSFDVKKQWVLGKYLIELSSVDSAGLPVKDMHIFTLVESGNHEVSDGQFFVFETDKPSYKAGDVAKVTIGSAASDMTFVIDVERNHRIKKTYVEHISGKRKELFIPVGDSKENGFAIYCTAIAYNHFIALERAVPVVTDEDVIEIETLSFKDKIQPGAKETWSFAIKGATPEKSQAEVLASMYDASLDQFKSHAWEFDPIEQETYYASGNVSAYFAFGTSSFDVRNLFSGHNYVQPFFFDQFDWFGFNINNYRYLRNRYLDRLYSSGIDPANPSKVSITNSKNVAEGMIVGRIVDKDGKPLPGVNVVVRGTTRGTATDGQGYYEIEASRKDILVFSFIGLVTAEAEVSRKNTINVQMEEDYTQLSEVVVTGYGEQRRKAMLGYAVTKVEADTIAMDFALAPLQGRVAGVAITGLPGGPSRIVIRGMSSIDQSKALYVVDGVVVEESQIDQSNLANIEVLKGDVATALYGSRAANGVIVITTKAGQKKMDEEMAKLQTRKDFKETAFFFPQLNTDPEGKIRFTFTTPESLTRWKLQMLAHRKDLVSTIKIMTTVTQKEFMVTPNPPRFLRQGDEIVFFAKISNLTNKVREGKIALQLSDAVTNASVDDAFANQARNKNFKVGPKATSEVSWRLKIPTTTDVVQYRVVARSGNHSDGEQNILPVLPNKILVTETLPMYVRGGQSKEFTLNKLKDNKSSTLTHHKLTLEVTTNPAWYALQALPYLMEFPYECAEQTFARYYANTLGSHIVNSTPKIKEVFSKWSSSDALISNLEKNQELKSLIIQETPWLRDATNESEQKKRIAELFNLTKLKQQQEGITEKLQAMQMSNGGFPWFAGAPTPSRFITQHIALSFGHLKFLNVPSSPEMTAMILQAVKYCDQEALDGYHLLLEFSENAGKSEKDIQARAQRKKAYLEEYRLWELEIQYLYMRTFFPEIPISSELQAMIDYYSTQTQRHWLDYPLYLRGMITLIQSRYRNVRFTAEKLRSLRETSITSEELGMYWKENQAGWNWFQSPVETQSLLIELFSEVSASDQGISEEEKRRTVDELRIWLLKNKQTSQWKTTKATTDAVYALLMNGSDWLSLDSKLETKIGGQAVVDDPGMAEAGTGYFKKSWDEKAIIPQMATVTLAKKDAGVAWGGLYWQYFEDLDKITQAETPLKLKKKVFLVTRDARGEKLEEVEKTTVKVGDLLRVRIELSVDRHMEFLHMKDMRGAGFEPVDVLSEYKWQQGLGYYQSTRDAATNFFFDSVDKGIYVFEYDLRVNNAGDFSNGITTIQCMYAPEFTSHSEGIRIRID